MRKRLWKIAELAFRVRIVLLGKKPEVIPDREQFLEKGPRILSAAHQVQTIGEPERAEKKNAFCAWQPIPFSFGAR